MKLFDSRRYLNIAPVDLWPKRIQFGLIRECELLETIISNPMYSLVGTPLKHWSEEQGCFCYRDVELIWEKDNSK